MKALKALYLLAKEAFDHWKADKANRLAAALSYYTIFALAPILVVVIALAGMVFGEEAARGEIVTQLEDLIGRSGAEFVQSTLQNLDQPRAGARATAFGLATILIGATGVFGHLQGALNQIWNVEPRPMQPIWWQIRTRLLSFAMILVIGFLLLISLAISAGVTAFVNYMGDQMAYVGFLTEVANIAISFLITVILLAMIYRILPDADIAWKDVWLGATITAVLFSLGKFAIGFYLGQSAVVSTYGAAGSIVVMLLWVYYSAQIIFYGAEFTAVYAYRYGSRIRPAKYARYIDPDRFEDLKTPLDPATTPLPPPDQPTLTGRE